MAEMSIAKMNKVLRKTRIQGRSPSAFQIYMEEQRLELGVYFNSNQEAVNRFLPEWKKLSEQEKDKYRAERLARRPHGQKAVDEFWEKKRLEKEAEALKEMETKVKVHETYDAIDKQLLEGPGSDMTTAHFILIHASTYCDIEREFVYRQPRKLYDYYPREIALASFTLSHGIVDNYWTLIDIGLPFPEGGRDEINVKSSETGMPMPGWERPTLYDDEQRKPYFDAISKKINKFIWENLNPSTKVNEPFAVYCLNRDMDMIDGCLDYIYKKAGDLQKHIKLYSYEQLVLTLYHQGRKLQSERFDTHIVSVEDFIRDSENNRKLLRFDVYSDAGILLANIRGGDGLEPAPLVFEVPYHPIFKVPFNKKKVDEDQLDFLSNHGIFLNETQVELFSHFGKHYRTKKELACEFHQRNGSTTDCPLHTVNRQAYIILEHLAQSFGLELQKGIQFPDEPEKERVHHLFLLAQWDQFGYSATVPYPTD